MESRRTKTQGCTTQISWRAKKNFANFFAILRAILICFYPFECAFIKKTSLNRKILGFAGQIKSFRGPHLARGPYVVHAWYRWNYFIMQIIFCRKGHTDMLRSVIEIEKDEWYKNGLNCPITTFKTTTIFEHNDQLQRQTLFITTTFK